MKTSNIKTNAMPNATMGKAWDEVSASFDRFCLAAGIDFIGKATDETATQVTRIGLTFLGTSVFHLLSLLSPDSALLGGSERINVLRSPGHRGEWSHGKCSVAWRAIQSAVGFAVTPSDTQSRRPWRTMTRQYRIWNPMVGRKRRSSAAMPPTDLRRTARQP